MKKVGARKTSELYKQGPTFSKTKLPVILLLYLLKLTTPEKIWQLLHEEAVAQSR